MASRTQTPEQFREPLVALAKLPEVQAQRLIKALQEAPPLQEVGVLEGTVADAVGGDHRASAELLMDALLSLSGRFRDLPLEDVMDAASSAKDLDLADDERRCLRDRLLALGSTQAIKSTANAVDLLTENELNYSRSRILTDVRHVFADDASERPMGAVIIETLALHMWDRNGDEQTLHVAMDEADLMELKKATQRALDKTANLKRMLGEQQMPYFELDKREL